MIQQLSLVISFFLLFALSVLVWKRFRELKANKAAFAEGPIGPAHK
jgi:hypothetical protein